MVQSVLLPFYSCLLLSCLKQYETKKGDFLYAITTTSDSLKDRWHIWLCNSILDASICGEVYTINTNQAVALVYPPGVEAKSSPEAKWRYHQEYQKLAREENNEHEDWVANSVRFLVLSIPLRS